ncbi:DUF4249 domain-containing protein [Tamlana sp. 2_MG-2023]|uniref:DUF4249 domain-containing protein n=1 Tax=unclassified Tamlana TaxID=2614803 RepID=UPI0026E4458C|nr:MULTISPECIES: DUF4249 domain-containing protein [unclassified Tamlana]MDO6759653.1 DUF4249 domain-containing protein [Tamlana sp. 2_MG-2023]MDO6791276.1 DUF4249 domain-containing protein [Tamlana sp. 1_MG-2023]
MKKYIYFSVVLVTQFLVSCTDVIDVDVPTADPRLVIEASLDWEMGTLGNNQTVKLSTTSAYFDNNSNDAVTNAVVSVTRLSDDMVFNFTNNNDGTYTTTNFEVDLNETYQLEVLYENEVYTATETLLATTPIKAVTQSEEGGILPDAIEVNVFFDDPGDETNFYVLRFKTEGDPYPELRDVSDEFLNGNEISIFYEKRGDDEADELQPGDVVDINLFNVSERYYKFIQLLNSQSGSGNPFAPTPVELRGNCVNTTNADNYAYGYFRVTQTNKRSVTLIDMD